MKDTKIIGTTIMLPSIIQDISRKFYVENLGFKLHPNGNVENGYLSINFIQVASPNLITDMGTKEELCKLVLQYDDLSLIDLSEIHVISDNNIPYGRFIYIKDVAENVICLSQIW